MTRRTATAAMLAGLTLGAAGVPAQDSNTTKTTDTYDASSTSDDIRLSCKELSASSQRTLSAKCNKTLEGGDVGAVSTTINMLTYVNCSGRWRYKVNWGSASTNVTLVEPHILLSSTGDNYYFAGYCQGGRGKIGPSAIDIAEATNGLRNNAGSLAKR